MLFDGADLLSMSEARRRRLRGSRIAYVAQSAAAWFNPAHRLMYQGQVVEQGLKTEVLAPPHAAYTELLLSSVPQMDPDWLTGLLTRRKSICS